MPHDAPINEITSIQVVSFGSEQLPEVLPKSFEAYRIIRRHPTVSLARVLGNAPMVAAEWSVESDDDVPEDRVEFVRELVGLHEPIMERALLGGLDFGWQPFEKVFAIKGGRAVLRKLKPLLHDLTIILIDPVTGAFAGFKQGEVVIPLENSLLISFGVEGTQWYGQSQLEIIRPTHDKWVLADRGAEKYDKKIAGSHWVIYYPHGSTSIAGKDTDNSVIAATMLRAMEASAGIMMPSTVAKFVDQMKAPPPGWRIEILSDKGTSSQAKFVERLAYLDKIMVRGLGWPERAILEGTHGTKAEASVHSRAAVTAMDVKHRYVTRLINWHMVDQLLALNWGEDARGTVRLVASPIEDVKVEWLREVYLAMLKNPDAFAEEAAALDRTALRETLDVPSQDQPDLPLRKSDPEDPLNKLVAEVIGTDNT